MNYDYDAIVIGGGPAGSTFSRVAAKNGMNVLIIDKRREIGVPVRCGEGLGARELVKEGLEIPRSAYSTEILGAKVVAPNGKEIIWKDEETKGYMLERKFFDKWLCELAVDGGAKVLTYTRAVDIIKDNGKVGGVRVVHGAEEPYEIRAPMVVSAEGMEAHIARKMGFDTVHKPYDVDTCYQYEMKPYEHENLIELYFGNDIAPRGYVWIFPKADKKANVGLGIGGNVLNGTKRGGMKGSDPKTLLDNFIENNSQLKDASRLEDFGGVISVGSPLNEFVKDNFMVIGTAAKQVDPIHGGGIALAMESGMMAGQVVADAYSKKDYSSKNLKPYENEWKEGPGKKVHKRLLLRKVVEKLNDDDLNYIFSQISDQDLNKVMKSNFAPAVAKVVAGRPQLVKVLSALIS
ncbi:NAD(P)/FAD-dependent oxidoreductase [Candidatus Micrarchaeota archaeon]|nr:NAD(P)/FAD-dependent oxidoreductase [Candidatus Micrarchaeota archaeon]